MFDRFWLPITGSEPFVTPLVLYKNDPRKQCVFLLHRCYKTLFAVSRCFWPVGTFSGVQPSDFVPLGRLLDRSVRRMDDSMYRRSCLGDPDSLRKGSFRFRAGWAFFEKPRETAFGMVLMLELKEVHEGMIRTKDPISFLRRPGPPKV